MQLMHNYLRFLRNCDLRREDHPKLFGKVHKHLHFSESVPVRLQVSVFVQKPVPGMHGPPRVAIFH